MSGLYELFNDHAFNLVYMYQVWNHFRILTSLSIRDIDKNFVDNQDSFSLQYIKSYCKIYYYTSGYVCIYIMSLFLNLE